MELYRKADLSILGERSTTERRQGLKIEYGPEYDEREHTTEDGSAAYKFPIEEHHSHRNGNVVRSRSNKISKSGPFSDSLEPAGSEDTPTLKEGLGNNPRLPEFGIRESTTRQDQRLFINQPEVVAEVVEKTSNFLDPISHSESFRNEEDVNIEEVIRLKARDQAEHKIGKTNTSRIAISAQQPIEFIEELPSGLREESFAHDVAEYRRNAREDARPRRPRLTASSPIRFAEKDSGSQRVSTNSDHQLRSAPPKGADIGTIRQLHPNIGTQEFLFQSSTHSANASEVPIQQRTITQPLMFIKGTISEDRSGDQESITRTLLAALRLRDDRKILQLSDLNIGNIPSDASFATDVEDFSDNTIKPSSPNTIGTRDIDDLFGDLEEEFNVSSTRLYLGNLARGGKPLIKLHLARLRLP